MARFVWLQGLSDYETVHALQRRLVERRALGEIDDVVLLLEHTETITVGRKRDARSNVLLPEGVPVVAVERGGDVTWHGPGQLVAYPIVQLEGARADLHLHLRSLEQAVIELLGGLGLEGRRDSRNTGVWLAGGQGLPQKVCSVGIACRRWVTWHGLALNVRPERRAFHRIRPCGFEPDVMTRLLDHMGLDCPTPESLAPALAVHLAEHLHVGFDAWETAPSPEEVEGLLS